MRFKIKFITALILLYLFPLMLFYAPQAQAADVKNLATTASEKGDLVIFYATLIHTGAGTDNVYTKAIAIDGLELVGATIQCISQFGTTNRDVNIDIQGSNSLLDSTFESYQTRGEFDDFSPDGGGLEATALLDRDFAKANTITQFLAATNISGVQPFFALSDTSADTDVLWTEKDQALRCRWIRVVSDGQTSNPATSSTLVILQFKKAAGYYGSGASIKYPRPQDRVKSTRTTTSGLTD
jgi:hypothetical protein